MKTALPTTIADTQTYGHSTKYTRWAEALDEGGNRYFWHMDRRNTQWEQPEEGFVSLDEQYVTAAKEAEKAAKKKEAEQGTSSGFTTGYTGVVDYVSAESGPRIDLESKLVNVVGVGGKSRLTFLHSSLCCRGLASGEIVRSPRRTHSERGRR